MPRKALLVSPHRGLLVSLPPALEQGGWEVVSTDNARRVLTLLDEAIPDVVIMDALLPNVHLSVEQIREMAYIPIILIGPHPTSERWKQALEAGADAYLSILADLDELLSTIIPIVQRYQRIQSEFPIFRGRQRWY
jgi:two-component system phosphate regulon response regulator PhoB